MITYNEYIAETVSEKITLAHVHCKWRAYSFSTYSGNIHSKVTDYFVYGVTQDDVVLTLAADRDSVIAGTFYFDITNSTLYVYSSDIDNSEVILTYRLFFSNAPIKLPWDLSDTGEEVYYEPRIKSTSGISIKISEEIKGMALIGTSRLVLEALDGYFDGIFEKFIWDNKEVIIYSYNRNILPSTAKVIYRGVIATRSYDNKSVSFSLKDYMKLLEKNTHSLKFEDTEDVVEDVVDNFKRRIFGKVDGLKLQSVDQMGETLTLTGTLSVLQECGIGLVWSEGESIPAAMSLSAGSGEYNSGFVCGHFSSGTPLPTQRFNGLSWDTSGNLNNYRTSHAAAGTKSAGVCCGGLYGGVLNSSEKYNGSAWSNSGNLNVGRWKHTSSGIQNAALCIDGDTDDTYKIYTKVTETFDGTSWSSGASTSISRGYASAFGYSNNTIVTGGTVDNSSSLDSAEKYNGTAWSSIGTLTTSRYSHSSGGVGSNLSAGGGSQGTLHFSCERYNSILDAWFITGYLNTPRWYGVGFGSDSTGSSFSGLISHGKNYEDGNTATSLTSTEKCIGGKYAVIGDSTEFLSELTPGDLLNIEGEKYSINEVFSDVSLSLSNLSTVEISGETIEANLQDPFNKYNRIYSISPKALYEFETTFTESYSTTLFKVADASKFRAGDIIQADTTTPQQRTIVRVVTSQNQIQISESWTTLPTDGVTTISRPAVQSVYLQKQKVPFTLYTITNNSTDGCYITFEEDFEKNFTKEIKLNSGFDYYHVAREYNSIALYRPEQEQPEVDLKPRDYIKLDDYIDNTYSSDWLQILKIDSKNVIWFRPNADSDLTDFNQGQLKARKTTILDDTTLVSADVYGETEDGEPDGTWIKSSAQLFKVLLTEAGYGDLLNTTSFSDAEDTEYAVLSLVTPPSIGKTGETLKNLILRVNESVNTVLTVDDELKLKYFTFDGTIDYDNLVTITDTDVIKWEQKQANPPLFSNLSTQYRFKDIDYLKESSTSSVYDFENDFVTKFVEVENTKELKHYLYDEIDVLSTTQRAAFLSTLTSSVYSITSDLRYQNLEIGDVVQLEFLNVKSSNTPSTNKLAMVIEITKNDDSVSLTVSDLGNLFNRRSCITPDTAPDYDDATADEKLIYSYITDDNGLMDGDEDTAGGSLII